MITFNRALMYEHLHHVALSGSYISCQVYGHDQLMVIRNDSTQQMTFKTVCEMVEGCPVDLQDYRSFLVVVRHDSDIIISP